MGSLSAPVKPPSDIHRAWWKESSVYQIWPASFKDSNDDGVGDIPGIISKLDYIRDLGIDIVWLCPSYKSPQVDMGYDIADYYSIADEYGTVADVEKLIKGCHDRGMKLLMDLVVNHTSDQNEWFKKSRSSKDSEFRDWYVWRPPRFDENGNRQPPNNWVSHFQGSAWEFDEPTGEYYLHLYATEQPDLNWENPAVRKAVHDIVRFWLDKGADGFRMDVINFISKDQAFPDAPNQDKDAVWQWGDKYYANGPRLHEYLQGVGKILKEYDTFSVGEMPFVKDTNEVLKAVRYDRDEINMIFNFEHVDIDHAPYGNKFKPGSWKLTDLKNFFERWQVFMYNNGGWNALYWENHDQPRSIDRYVNPPQALRQTAGKMLATVLALHSGSPFIYQGQEIGMGNVPVEWGMEEYKDIDCLNHWKGLLETKKFDTEAQTIARQEYQKKSRDNGRTPVQWSAAPNGGFTGANVKPWMSVNPEYSQVNAEGQVKDPQSLYHYWNSVLTLRKKYLDIFVYGNYELVDRDSQEIYAYTRAYDTSKALVLANWTDHDLSWNAAAQKIDKVKEVLLDSYESASAAQGRFSGAQWTLRPYEAVVILLE